MRRSVVKVQSYVSKEANERLEDIVKKYGFKSKYEILQYLIDCFLRVADPASDTKFDPVPYEIEQMFSDYAEGEKHFECVKPKRKAPKKAP